jgi:hypothetical protein
MIDLFVLDSKLQLGINVVTLISHECCRGEKLFLKKIEIDNATVVLTWCLSSARRSVENYTA